MIGKVDLLGDDSLLGEDAGLLKVVVLEGDPFTPSSFFVIISFKSIPAIISGSFEVVCSRERNSTFFSKS